MTLVPGLELVAPRKVRTEDDDLDDLEVVEVPSPLTIIRWAAAVVLAGIATIAVMLLLGPIFGTVAVVAVTLSIVRRYERAEGQPTLRQRARAEVSSCPSASRISPAPR